MDPAIDLAPTAGPSLTLRQVAIGVAALFVLTIGGLWLFEAVQRVASGELIWPIPADVWTGVVFLTALLVILGAMRMLSNPGTAPGAAPRGGSRVDALVAGPILLLIAISAAARLGVQLVGFAGLHPGAVPVPFTVLDTSHRQSRGGSDYYLLRLRYRDGARAFDDEVRRSVYEAAKGGDTVILPVETGRFGLQRAVVATPLSVADLHHHG